MKTKYRIGDEVQSVSDPSRIGTIVEIGPVHGGLQYYRVNFGGGIRRMVAEIDIRRFIPSASPIKNLLDGNISGYREFQRLITYHRLSRERPLRNNIYAFNASRTRFYPYQFKPLIKFLDSPNHRLILADEVGLGKTIEAGLILMELKARQTISKVLVICPANLKEKWFMELKRRFDEDFEILSAQDFNRFLDEYEEFPERGKINGIISLESIRQDHILDRLEALNPNFDLIIIDEAHHMRNFGTKQRKAGSFLGRSDSAILLLTATPIHLGNENLFSLLNILEDEEFSDLESVNTRLRDNEPIIKCQICLGQLPPNIDGAKNLFSELSQISWIRKNPLYNDVFERMKLLERVSGNELNYRRQLIELQRDIAELSAIAHIFTRTRKKEVHENMSQRRACTVRMKFTEQEKLFYDTVTEYVRAKNRYDIASSLLLIMPQRRVASSIPAMIDFYRRNFGLDSEDRPDDFRFGEDGPLSPYIENEEIEKERRELYEIVTGWPKNGLDSKYNKLIDILKECPQKKIYKIIIFAFFKDTLRYLANKLNEDGFKSVLIHGDVDPDERPKIIEKFKNEPEIRVLLSSRVGSEGLDLQFCDTMVNYDLPWNPMEVEQRIGRLDRIGQESPVINIYNFWIEGTIEQRMLERLYQRIDIFRRSIGELEIILGDELEKLWGDLLTRKLTPQEEEERISRTALAIERRLKDIEKLERESARFIGTDQYFEEEVKMIRKCRRYVTGEQLRHFLSDFIRNNCPRTRLEYNIPTKMGLLFPDEKLHSFMISSSGPLELPRGIDTTTRGIPITFSSDVAYNNPNMEFINILHPLIQNIVRHYKNAQQGIPNAHHVVLESSDIPAGHYFYFIFRINIHAARESSTLEMLVLDDNGKVICNFDKAEILLGEMVENGRDPESSPIEVNRKLLSEVWKCAEDSFLGHLRGIRREIERNNDVFINRRLESLNVSYKKNLDRLRSRLAKAEEEGKQERYLRMLRGTISRLENEWKSKSKSLEEQRKIEVTHEEIAAGILEVLEKGHRQKKTNTI